MINMDGQTYANIAAVILSIPLILWLSIDHYALVTNNTELAAKSDGLRDDLRKRIYGV